MINYASYVFEKSGGSILSTNMSSIILAFVQIVGGLVSTQMGDTFGRKTTLAISLCGSIVGLISFAAYLHIRENGYDVTHFVWLPLTSLSLIIFVSSAGILALSNTCAIENFPSKVDPLDKCQYIQGDSFKSVNIFRKCSGPQSPPTVFFVF